MDTSTLGSRGPDVKYAQSLLTKLGYNPEYIDGVFRQQTKQAIIAFQRKYLLIPDGIVGPVAWRVLENFLREYDIYIIKSVDTKA